jgi:thioredoxin reductase (NADPH)
MLIRGPGLAATMSNYLVIEISSHPKISVRVRSEIVDGGGSGGLESLIVVDRSTGRTEILPATALFVMIGAEPRTDWLSGTVARDPQGYLLTSQHATAAYGHPAWPLDRPPMLLETTVPGSSPPEMSGPAR